MPAYDCAQVAARPPLCFKRRVVAHATSTYTVARTLFGKCTRGCGTPQWVRRSEPVASPRTNVTKKAPPRPPHSHPVKAKSTGKRGASHLADHTR